MKRHKALQSLSQEHHHALIISQLIKFGSPKFKGLPITITGKKSHTVKFFRENLISHFRKEEGILFPLLRGKSTDIENLVKELVSQHKEIHSLVEQLKISVKPEIELDTIGKLLEVHIRKEERELFQMIQEILSEGELIKLGSELGEGAFGCNI
jgi:iron-sulfur cluster repair protein YtfE (RIC family)